MAYRARSETQGASGFNLRLNPLVRLQIAQAAEVMGVSLTAFIEAAAAVEAQRVLRGRSMTELNDLLRSRTDNRRTVIDRLAGETEETT